MTNMKYSNHYSKWHDHRDLNYVNFMKRKFKRTFGEYLPSNKDSMILELGCANGLALLTLRDMGYTNLLGVEIDEDLAMIAKSQDLPVEIIDAFIFIKETTIKFDFIYLFDVLEHLDTELIPEFLIGIHDILNDNGKMMLVVPNATSPAGAYFRYIDWTHTTSFTPASISFLLEEAGFRNIKIMDESLIEKPEKEEIDTVQSYDFASRLSDNARFYEAFSRWGLQSMFGTDKYSNIVAPNMKVVVSKVKLEKLNIEFQTKDNDIFNLFDFSVKVKNSLIEFEELKKKYNILKDEVDKNKTTLDELHKLIEIQSIEFSDYRKSISDAEETKKFELMYFNYEINNELQLMVDEIDKNRQNTDFLLMTLIKIVNKQSNTTFSKISKKIKSYKLKRIISNSGYFDSEYYLKEYPDVSQAGIDPILHYLMYGAYEGRNPSMSFNTLDYWRAHPEILIDNINPLIHMLHLNNKDKKTRSKIRD